MFHCLEFLKPSRTPAQIDDNLKKAESHKEEAEIAAATYTVSSEARADAYAIIMETRSRILRYCHEEGRIR